MSTKRSKRVKNLEEEVESVFSQNESDGDCKAVLSGNQNIAKHLTAENILEVTTPKRERPSVLQDMMQTPRRSSRKSVKPAQDYDDIVKRSLRSCTQSGKKALSDDVESCENDDVGNAHPRWTSAKVGRVSQKRGRKSKRSEKGKSRNDKKNTEQMEDIHGIKKEESGEGEYILGTVENVIEILNPLDDNLEQTTQIMQREKLMDQTLCNFQCLNVNQEHLNKKEVEEHRNYVLNSDANIKIHNQSIQLIQEDSEDDSVSIKKSEPEKICIIYEKNISNKNDIQSESPTSMTVDTGDSFGGYLKSRQINLSDLGLNPISHEEDKDVPNFKTTAKEVEEMPSLIICDDDEEVDSKPTETLNVTFEAEENVKTENRQKENDETMEILQLSDDGYETPKKYPRIMLTDTSAQNRTLLSNIREDSAVGATTPSMSKTYAHKLPITPKQTISGSAIKAKMPSTPKTPKYQGTPQQSKKLYRFPTPYRSRKFKFDDEVKENIQKIPNKVCSNSSLISVTTLEPKEVVLRGIRKRSLSVCINVQQRQDFLRDQKQNRVVSFYSPANQTTVIDDLDTIIAKSLKKQKLQEKESSKKFVTTRRKRSISLDESFMSSSIASKLPRPVLVQNVSNITKSTTSSKTLKRTKLPNFSAIHEKNFNKMESLVDHVNRKQERSRNLVNSASKLISASAQKNISLNKIIKNKVAEKPMALKKIDLNPNPQKIEKSDLNKKLAIPKRPVFNLSTSLVVKPTAPASTLADKANTTRLHNDNKMESRLQRHMELFKGRAPSTRTGLATRRNEVILKGVRSNRRFELQMQHRKNLEQ